MNPEETLKYWRDNLCSEENVKRQLLDEYINAETEEDISFLDKIHDLIFINKHVCNYCLELVEELPDKFCCKECIKKHK